MDADPLILMVVNRPDQDIDTLQGAQEPCHQGQIFIPAHGILRGQTLGGLAGPDDVDPIQRGLSLDRLQASGIGQPMLRKLSRTGLGPMGVVQHLPDLLANLSRRQRRSLNLSQFVARKHWLRRCASLTVSAPISCKEASYFEADAVPCTLTSTSYKL